MLEIQFFQENIKKINIKNPKKAEIIPIAEIIYNDNNKIFFLGKVYCRVIKNHQYFFKYSDNANNDTGIIEITNKKINQNINLSELEKDIKNTLKKEIN